jgi:hypothetical protein
MFIDSELSKIDVKIFTDNYKSIKKDYLNFKNSHLFFDYSHEYNLTVDDEMFTEFVPIATVDYPWKVCPIIFKRKVIPISPKSCQDCFTTKLLLSQSIKPVLATFSILEPGANLEPHSDGDERIDSRYIGSSVIKFHFCLDTYSDGECALVVNDEKRILSNGDINLFDEKLSKHYAYNFSSKSRGVLIASYIRDEVLK